ncbi:MAG: Gluconate 2-dehydrogenase, membrane-bound, gamma subunit, partial [uncultured Acetobacteraceae bacterium]
GRATSSPTPWPRWSAKAWRGCGRSPKRVSADAGWRKRGRRSWTPCSVRWSAAKRTFPRSRPRCSSANCSIWLWRGSSPTPSTAATATWRAGSWSASPAHTPPTRRRSSGTAWRGGARPFPWPTRTPCATRPAAAPTGGGGR